jgi:hypothetical protein
MTNVLKYDDLLKIEEYLRESGYDNGNLSVVMGIETQERLNRINKDYFYKVNKAGKPNEGNVDKVNVQIGNVKFIYQLKERND